MRLSKTQFEVMKRLQDGWAMRTGWNAIGFTVIRNTKCLQKNGHGSGGETFMDFTIATVHSLEKKGLIKQDGTVFMDSTNWVLTEKGKNLQLEPDEAGPNSNGSEAEG